MTGPLWLLTNSTVKMKRVFWKLKGWMSQLYPILHRKWWSFIPVHTQCCMCYLSLCTIYSPTFLFIPSISSTLNSSNSSHFFPSLLLFLYAIGSWYPLFLTPVHSFWYWLNSYRSPVTFSKKYSLLLYLLILSLSQYYTSSSIKLPLLPFIMLIVLSKLLALRKMKHWKIPFEKNVFF